MQDIKRTLIHLTKHQRYPVSRNELITRWNGLEDLSTEDKRWLKNNLPVGYYLSADNLLEVLKIKSLHI